MRLQNLPTCLGLEQFEAHWADFLATPERSFFWQLIKLALCVATLPSIPRGAVTRSDALFGWQPIGASFDGPSNVGLWRKDLRPEPLRVSVKWFHRLFIKNTALCKHVSGSIGCDACPVPEG